jgi:hypothetical protein
MMKKNLMSTVRRNLLVLGGVVLVGIGLSACSKSDDNSNPDVPVAGLMAFNLSTDQDGVGITLSGNNLVSSALNYTSYTGGYLGVYTGTRAVRSFNAASGTTLAETSNDFAANKYYSLFVAGANSSYRNIVVLDNFDSLATGNNQAYIRYVNAIPDSAKPNVTIVGNGQTVINDNNAGFAAVSNFVAVSPGDVTITASNGGTIQTTRTISVTQPKIYTVLLVGVPGATDANKAVQIKYIENGSLSATSQQRTTNGSGSARIQ